MTDRLTTHETTAVELHARGTLPPAAWVAFATSYREGASRTNMVAALRAVTRLLGHADPQTFPWHQLRYEHVRAINDQLRSGGLGRATHVGRLIAVRRMLEECWKLGLLSLEEWERIRTVKPPAADPNAPLAGRVLEPQEQEALFAAAARGPGAAAARDTALLVLGLSGGLRREEIAELPLWNGQLGLDATRVVVNGKGNKIREVPLGLFTASRMQPWLALRGTVAGPLLLALRAQSYHAPRTPLDHGLSPSGVYSMLKDLGYRARLKDFSPHDLRRTFVTELLEAAVDPITVARMAGHEDVKTTMRYDRRGEKAKRAAAEALDKLRRGDANENTDTKSDR